MDEREKNTGAASASTPLETPTLRACPFCGGGAAVKVHRVAEDAETAYVMCRSCGARTEGMEGPYADREYAVREWNTRQLRAASGEVSARERQGPSFSPGADTAPRHPSDAEVGERVIPSNLGERVEFRLVSPGDRAAYRSAGNAYGDGDGPAPEMPFFLMGERVEFRDQHVSGLRGRIVEIRHEYLIELEEEDEDAARRRSVHGDPPRIWASERDPNVELCALPSHPSTATPAPAGVPDLMKALQESLAEADDSSALSQGGHADDDTYKLIANAYTKHGSLDDFEEALRARAELDRLRSVARVAGEFDPDKKESLVWDIYESLRDDGGAVRADNDATSRRQPHNSNHTER